MESASKFSKLIPVKLHDDTILFGKAKLIIGVGFCLSIFSFLIAVRQFSIQLYVNGLATVACGFLMLVLIFTFRRSGSIFLTGNGIILMLFILLTLLTARYGGLGSIITPWFVSIVILGIMISGFRMGVLWGGGSFGLLTAMYLMQTKGYQFSDHVSNLASTFVSFGVLTLVMMFLGLIHENVVSKSQTSLKEEREKSDQAANDLKKAIDEVNQVMELVTRFDFTRRVTGDYQDELDMLKNGVNGSLDILSGIIDQSKTISSKVDSSTVALEKSARALSDDASAQAAGLEQISSSMAEIGTRAKTNDDNASQTQKLSTQTLEEVNLGNQQMNALQQSMKQIHETSSQITKIISVINQIASQTNLLALNAAVEAARAGRYGKGFAVVAEEVRSLAGRSAEAAKDTNELIGNAIAEVENGVKNADETASILTSVNASMGKVTDLVGEISAASVEQSSSIEEINQGLTQMNDLVQRNTAIAEQTASTSGILSDQSRQLHSLLDKFKLR